MSNDNIIYKEVIKDGAFFEEECPFCAKSVMMNEEVTYSDERVTVYHYTCRNCGAHGQARYVFDGRIEWQKDE